MQTVRRINVMRIVIKTDLADPAYKKARCVSRGYSPLKGVNPRCAVSTLKVALCLSTSHGAHNSEVLSSFL